MGAGGVFWVILSATAAGVVIPWFFGKMEAKNGSWQPDQDDGSGARSDTGPYSRHVAATLARHTTPAFTPGSLNPLANARSTASPHSVSAMAQNPTPQQLRQMIMQSQHAMQLRIAAQQGYLMGGMMGGGPLPPSMPPGSWVSASSGSLGNYAPGYPTVMKSCELCGMAGIGAAHKCPELTQLDQDVVRTIQMLAAEGLSPEEIAGDMKLTIGWRKWTTAADIGGAGSGNVARWPLDKATRAVCINAGCSIQGAREACAKRAAPICRIHAWKTKEQNAASDYGGVSGAVALWGTVIECQKGYLATRAYPLGFDSEAWARGYRVAYLKPPSADPQP